MAERNRFFFAAYKPHPKAATTFLIYDREDPSGQVASAFTASAASDVCRGLSLLHEDEVGF